MTEYFKKSILDLTGAKELKKIEVIQELWSGYGEIIRYKLYGTNVTSIVVKYIKTDISDSHPRGWNTDISHNRKIKSYVIEKEWYNKWSKKLSEGPVIPKLIGTDYKDSESLIILEDINNLGYDKRITTISIETMKRCLTWLASFHSNFINQEPKGLWENGTYWHLDTRPEELEALKDEELKSYASKIEAKLNNTRYKTIVHGDAKLANFCFSNDEKMVAMVDFQYVGGGCGVKDVAYFIGSCLYEDDCEKYEDILLNHYFMELKNNIQLCQNINSNELISSWRELYPYAWADFHRFLKGWSPGHWKINSYSEKLTRRVIDELKRG